jgi:hypothetical protein
LQVWLLDITENKEVAENTELEKQQEIGAVTSILWQGVGFGLREGSERKNREIETRKNA